MRRPRNILERLGFARGVARHTFLFPINAVTEAWLREQLPSQLAFVRAADVTDEALAPFVVDPDAVQVSVLVRFTQIKTRKALDAAQVLEVGRGGDFQVGEYLVGRSGVSATDLGHAMVEFLRRNGYPGSFGTDYLGRGDHIWAFDFKPGDAFALIEVEARAVDDEVHPDVLISDEMRQPLTAPALESTGT